MKPSVYLETSVISYLAARPSRDVITRAHQQVTRNWWTRRRRAFRLFISELVLDEIRRGDRAAARRRERLVTGVPVLRVTEAAGDLTRALLRRTRIPAADAAHVAVAALNGMEYLLTWNCRHIANAQMRQAIEETCEGAGYTAPTLCTPEELMGA